MTDGSCKEGEACAVAEASTSTVGPHRFAMYSVAVGRPSTRKLVRDGQWATLLGWKKKKKKKLSLM